MTLSVRGLTVALPHGADRARAVEDVSFDLAPGETLCLVGESGSGKSITAAAALGMLPRALRLEAGKVALEGAALPPQRARAWDAIRGARIAMIFQDAAASLDPVQRIGTQLLEVLAVHGWRGDRRARALEMLAAVQLPDPGRAFRSYPHQLSGGQLQRCVIAGALLLDPAVLIADEPTTALDVTTQAEILRLIADLQAARGTAVLFITHDMGVVAEIADRVGVMRGGRIVEAGTRDAVLGAPQHPYTQALLAAAPVPSDRAPRPAAPILEGEGLRRTYRGTVALDGVSLALGRGETLGVVGESGSGKSTLARCLLRLDPLDAGRVRFDGRDVGVPDRAFRRRVQVVLQDPIGALDPRQRVGDAVAEGPRIHGLDDPRGRAARLLDQVGLPGAGGRYPHEFSGGQRQRICIARALALEPEVLIADEPVSALDLSIQAQILDLFADLQARLGFAMLFITHDLRVAAAICDRVIVMRHGRVVEAGRAAETLRAPAHAYTQALVAAAPGGVYA